MRKEAELFRQMKKGGAIQMRKKEKGSGLYE